MLKMLKKLVFLKRMWYFGSGHELFSAPTVFAVCHDSNVFLLRLFALSMILELLKSITRVLRRVGADNVVPAPRTIPHSLKETLIFLAFLTFFFAHTFIFYFMRNLRYVLISFVFILHTFLTVEVSSSVCRELSLFKTFYQRTFTFNFIMNPGNGSSIILHISNTVVPPLMYQSNRSLNIPPGIPRAFDVFSCPRGREFDELSLPGGGAFDHYSQGVGNLIASLNFVLRVALIPNHGGDKS